MISELPVVSVHVSPALRAALGGHAEVMASGETVGQVLEAVGHQYPSWSSSVLGSDGQLADHVVVYLGGTSIRALNGLETPVGFEESLNIVWTGDWSERGVEQPHPLFQGLPEHAISIGES